MIGAIRRSVWLVIAASASFSMSTLFSSVKPVLLTQFMRETGVSTSLAGWLVAAPFIGIALATLLVAWLLSQFKYYQLITGAGATLVSAQFLLSVLFPYPLVTLLLQLVSGVMVGILMGVTSFYIAQTRTPGELFGLVDMVGVLLMSLMVAGVSKATGYMGVAGGYLFSGVLCAAYWALMYAYKIKPVTQGTNAQPDSTLQISVRPILIIVMGVLFVTFSGQGFAFMFSMADNLGMGFEDAGNKIGLILFISAFGCIAGGVCSARFGAERPLFVAFVVCAISWTIAINATSQTVFLWALFPAITMLQFSFPMLLVLAGTLDSAGKWAAVATPLLTSGFAWAAVLSGFIVQHWDIQALALSTQVGMGVCVVLLAVSVWLHRADRLALMTKALN
ncbi:MAG TPA: hypothetical protein DCW59_16455 [Alteromonas sp.]|nr:hypothetical protein [Alteromonas sp.]|tara:strand:- start:8629 stop:9804 length:1176 start_codon:yes stop_codon:yes gene_type:complete